MVRPIRKSGLFWAIDFACAARRYWLAVFPRVTLEVCRQRRLARHIPDPALRRLALDALERKRNNLEGAAAFAAIVPPASRPSVLRASVASQMMCDYLDHLSEQPSPDPVSNGYRLHEALIVATTVGEPHRDYYAHHPHGDDGGYLRGLVNTVRLALSGLPSIASIGAPMGRATERIAVYQSFNHGDALGSYEPFERWSKHVAAAHTDLYSWETAAGAGSTMTALALIASAADPQLGESDASAIENAYFPWIGSLHSLLDSLVDHDEDLACDGRALVDYYGSPLHAATRMRAIAGEALRRAISLPGGRRHALILAAMTSFYICEIHRSASPHAQLIAPGVLEAFGCLAAPTMAILGARRSLRRVSAGRSKPLAAGPPGDRSRFLESQVPDFPLFTADASEHHGPGHEPMPIRSRAPQGAGRSAHRR